MLQQITFPQHQFREGIRQQEGMMADGGNRPEAGTIALEQWVRWSDPLRTEDVDNNHSVC